MTALDCRVRCFFVSAPGVVDIPTTGLFGIPAFGSRANLRESIHCYRFLDFCRRYYIASRTSWFIHEIDQYDDPAINQPYCAAFSLNSVSLL